MATDAYESFPARIVLLSVGLSLACYVLGAYLLGRLGLAYAVAYLAYGAWVEVSVLRKSCAHCYYYGKTCGLGKGRVCALLFRRGDPRRFVDRDLSWRSVVPDMLVLAFPLLGGIILMIRAFAWHYLVIVLLLGVLSLGGSAVVRGSFVCRYCKQREMGCPAQELFAGRGAEPS